MCTPEVFPRENEVEPLSGQKGEGRRHHLTEGSFALGDWRTAWCRSCWVYILDAECRSDGKSGRTVQACVLKIETEREDGHSLQTGKRGRCALRFDVLLGSPVLLNIILVLFIFTL